MAAAGLSDVVQLVLADFTTMSEAGRQKLPEAGSVDLVTFSYSLSMIPDKEAALRQAARLLKAGGTLAIADFFARGETSYQVSDDKGEEYKLMSSRFDSFPLSAPPLRQSKPLTRYLSRTYDWGCRMWFKQDGVYLLQDNVFNAVEPTEVCWRSSPFVSLEYQFTPPSLLRSRMCMASGSVGASRCCPFCGRGMASGWPARAVRPMKFLTNIPKTIEGLFH